MIIMTSHRGQLQKKKPFQNNEFEKAFFVQ